MTWESSRGRGDGGNSGITVLVKTRSSGRQSTHTAIKFGRHQVCCQLIHQHVATEGRQSHDQDDRHDRNKQIGDQKAMAQSPQRLPGDLAKKPDGKPNSRDEGGNLDYQAETTAGRNPAERGVRRYEYEERNSRTAQPAKQDLETCSNLCLDQ